MHAVAGHRNCIKASCAFLLMCWWRRENLISVFLLFSYSLPVLQLATSPHLLPFAEPPKSFAIVQNNNAVESGAKVTVVDGKLETVHCESRKSNPAPILQWFLGDRELRASVQKNVTEDDDSRRWKAFSVLEYVFSQDDFGKSLICRVNHPAYANKQEETAVKLDLLCKYLKDFLFFIFKKKPLWLLDLWAVLLQLKRTYLISLLFIITKSFSSFQKFFFKKILGEKNGFWKFF